MRIAIGCFLQESQSFSPVPGSWAHYGPQELLRGEAFISGVAGTRTELGGALDVARGQGVEIVTLLSARSTASAGPILQEVFEALRDEMVQRLEQALPLDGLLLALHGGMIAEGYPDASGEVLRACRAVLGPQVPMAATLDLHANLTDFMKEQANALIGYHTFPHIDMFETGRRGMQLLLRIARQEVHPEAALKRLPMILPGENGQTTEGPFKDVMDSVIELSSRPGILDASAFSVQPWLDVPDIGCSVLVIADGDQALAEREARRIAADFWARRDEFSVRLTPTHEAVRMALASERHPFIFSDPSDAPSSGAPGDSPVILAELLAARPEKPCFINIVDPAAVQAMAACGIGAKITLEVGARFAPGFYSPLAVSGRVRLLADGDFEIKGPGMKGMITHRGLTGILDMGAIQLVVMERPVFQWDPELYRSVGLEPGDAQIVLVKSPAAFRAAYQPFAAEILLLDAPGVCSSDLRSFPFQHVRRPLYPLDEIEDWEAALPPSGKRKQP